MGAGSREQGAGEKSGKEVIKIGFRIRNQ